MSCECIPTNYGPQIAPVGAPKTYPWYLACDISRFSCIAAYKATGATDLAASYDNLAAPGNGLADGTYDLTAPVAAPAWNTVTGWTFDGLTQYLTTGIPIPDAQTWSMIVQFSSVTSEGYATGYFNTLLANGFMLTPNRLDAHRRYYNGNAGLLIDPSITEGVMAIAGATAYLDGVPDGTIVTLASTSPQFYIGADYDPWTTGVHAYCGLDIQAIAIYDAVLTEEEVRCVTNALVPFDLEPIMTFIAIPDTQTLARNTPADIGTIADWIVAQEADLNIAAVLHEGDQVFTDGDAGEWNAAEVLFDTLDAANIPYQMSIGNHDYDAGGIATRTATIWNARYPQARFTAKSWWSGGFYEVGHSENSYLIIGDYLLMALEFGPRQAVIDWANIIIAVNPTKRVWIVTHSHEFIDGSLVTAGDANNPHDYWPGPGGDTHDGAEEWDELVKLHENIEWVQSGHHVGGNAARHEGTGDNGNKVLNVFANWQVAGTGYIRIIKIYRGGGYILVRTYDPVTNTPLTDAANQFEVTFP